MNILDEKDRMIEKLTWREKFAAIMLIMIGFVYAAIQVMNIASSRAGGYSANESAIIINRGELLSDFKTYAIIFFSIIAGLFLIRQKRLGWILGIPVLLLFAFLSAAGLFIYVSATIFDNTFILLLIAFVVLASSVIFLLLPSARKKYKVGKYTYLPTLVFLMAICGLYFFLE